MATTAAPLRRKPTVPSLKLGGDPSPPPRGRLPSSMPGPQSRLGMSMSGAAKAPGGTSSLPRRGRPPTGASTHSLFSHPGNKHASSGSIGSAPRTASIGRGSSFFRGRVPKGANGGSQQLFAGARAGSSAALRTGMAAPKVLQPKRKPGDSDAGLSRAPAYRATQGRMGEAMARRAKGGGDGGGDGGSTAGGSSTTAGGGASSASRTAAQLTHIGSEEDGPSTVVVKTAAAAEDLVRAEAQLSSKLREAIRGGSSATKGRRAGQAASSKGTDQVARSLAKRRQARLEMARLRSQSAFVDWLWLGNTDRPDKVAEVAAFPAGSRTGATAPVAAVRPGSEASEGLDGRGSDAKLAASSTPIELAEAGDGASGPGGSPAQAWGSDAGDPAAGVLSTRSGNSGGAGSAQGRLDSGGADGKPADGATAGTERSVAPKQWTGAGKADGRVGRVKGGGGRNRRGSLGASAVDQILSDFDKHRAETGAEGGRKKRGARGVRGGGRHKAMGSGSAGDSKKAGDGPAAAPASSSKPQNEQAPEKGNVHARIAAKRRHLPDGGCARCWAISTRCCAEAWELRQARAAAAREGVVLTGRAQEAVEVLGITQSQIRTLHRHFVEMDDGLEGRIHLNDFFEEFLEMERSAVTDAIWLALVENTTGQMLGFEDFVLIVCVYCMFTEADILRFCFSTFDINGEFAAAAQAAPSSPHWAALRGQSMRDRRRGSAACDGWRRVRAPACQ